MLYNLKVYLVVILRHVLSIVLIYATCSYILRKSINTQLNEIIKIINFKCIAFCGHTVRRLLIGIAYTAAWVGRIHGLRADDEFLYNFKALILIYSRLRKELAHVFTIILL